MAKNVLFELNIPNGKGLAGWSGSSIRSAWTCSRIGRW